MNVRLRKHFTLNQIKRALTSVNNFLLCRKVHQIVRDGKKKEQEDGNFLEKLNRRWWKQRWSTFRNGDEWVGAMTSLVASMHWKLKILCFFGERGSSTNLNSFHLALTQISSDGKCNSRVAKSFYETICENEFSWEGFESFVTSKGNFGLYLDFQIKKIR